MEEMLEVTTESMDRIVVSLRVIALRIPMAGLPSGLL